MSCKLFYKILGLALTEKECVPNWCISFELVPYVMYENYFKTLERDDNQSKPSSALSGLHILQFNRRDTRIIVSTVGKEPQDEIVNNQMQSRAPGFAWRCIFRCQNRGLARNTILLTNNATSQLHGPAIAISTRAEGGGNSVVESSQSFQRRDFSVVKSSSVTPGNNLAPLVDRGEKRNHPWPRVYEEKAKNLLQQVKTRRIQPELVAQKVEELLLLSLSEYEHNVPSDGPLALELLNTALRYAKQRNVAERLLPRLFSLSCQLMLKSGHRSAVNEVHRQLWRLLDGHEEFLISNDTLYNTHHVNDACSHFVRHIVLNANAQKRKLDARKSRQLHRLIERLTELQRDPLVPLTSNPYIDDSLIMLLCNQLKPREAHEVLRRQVEKSSLTSPLCRERDVPLVSSFTTIINGYAKTSQPDKALSIINWMMSFQETDDFSSLSATKATNIHVVPPPNLNCFNGLLHAYAMDGSKNAGFKVEQTLEWMEKISETVNLDTKPNETSYNICINAWARSQHSDAPIRAENLLRRVVALGESGNQIEPSEEAITAVMNTWVNSSSSSGSSKQMREATDKVAGILDLIERISETSSRISLSVVPYTVLIKSWGKMANKLNGIEKQKCGDKILDVLARMHLKGVAPTTEMHNSILTSLIEISPLGAVFYFLELEQQYCNGNVKLDTRTFNCGLNAIAVLNRPDAVKKVTDVLTRMFEYQETDPSILPSNLTFNIILKVLSRSTSHMSDAAAKADVLLSEMDEMASATPDFISYVTCIIAWGRSHEKDKIQRVTKLLHRYVSSMKDHDERSQSSIAVFNAALSVCHHNSSQEHADEVLHAAKITVTELRKLKSINPDRKTYESFFQLIKVGTRTDSSSVASFTDLIEDEFIQCASDGFVTKDIILAVRSAIPQSTFERLVGKNIDPRTLSIPKGWCRNIVL